MLALREGVFGGRKLLLRKRSRGAAACTRPDGAVVYWTSINAITNVRGSECWASLVDTQNKDTSTGLRQPRTQHAWLGPRAFWVPGVWLFLAGVGGRRVASISINIVYVSVLVLIHVAQNNKHQQSKTALRNIHISQEQEQQQRALAALGTGSRAAPPSG